MISGFVDKDGGGERKVLRKGGINSVKATEHIAGRFSAVHFCCLGHCLKGWRDQRE